MLVGIVDYVSIHSGDSEPRVSLCLVTLPVSWAGGLSVVYHVLYKHQRLNSMAERLEDPGTGCKNKMGEKPGL